MHSAILGLIMLVGSYGSAQDTTFHTYDFDSTNGRAVLMQSLPGITNPSFLTVDDNGETILTVNENGGAAAGVTMMRRSGDNKFTYLPVASAPTEGADPCHIVISPDGKYAVTSNYSGGSVSIIPFDTETASFGETTVIPFTGSGPVAGRQDSPHAHFTTFIPDGRLMITNDLGTDRLHVFPIGEDGLPVIEKMYGTQLAPGSGPRHLVFDNKAENAYLINEIGGTVTHLRYDKKNETLTPVSDTLADYEHGAGSADIHLSPDGRFLYVTNRLKGDGIAVFAVDENDGSLTPAGFTPTGRHPRNFALTPDGHWLLCACRDDNRIEVYRRNTDNGSLTLSDTIPCPKPVCIIFIQTDQEQG